MARVTHDVTEGTGLSGPDFAVLKRLVELGRGEMRQQDLATSMRWDKSRLSHHLTRMETRKLIRRKRSADKGVDVLLTPEGDRQFSAARPVFAQSVRKHLLWRLSASQRKALLAACVLLFDD
jgi:DNA-binding MarR family transcriptional regulator